MWRLTRAWPSLFVVLVLASGCGGGSPTSPSLASFVLDCRLPAFGAMTATLDGTPWIPFSTRAWIPASRPAGLSLWASDCKDFLQIAIRDFKGVGTYDVAAGDVTADLKCDGDGCGLWFAAASTDIFGKPTVIGSGSVTVTAYTAPTPGEAVSGAIEGTFSFTLVESNNGGPIRTRVMTNGRFGSRFSGL